jgi:hypothetical protein
MIRYRQRQALALVLAALTLPMLAPVATAGTTIPQAATDIAASAVIDRAESERRKPLYSVVNKTRLPASEDAHDYFSFAPYWWPDPDSDDGLPYVRRDGEYNEATLGDATDKQRLIDFIDTVNVLSWSYRLTGDERYAQRAVAQLRHWFIAPETRMAPNLRYAQAIPGRVEGRGIGIIESRLLIGLSDSIRHLKPSPALTDETFGQLKQWYGDYLDWMLTSENGRKEHAKRNNHGTWYDAQVVAFARFVDRPALAKRQLHEVLDRLETQFEPDGRQPLELERTRPWHYANFNLAAWSVLLREASALGLTWPEEEADRARLAAAYRWVADHAANPDDWSYQELHGFDSAIALPNLVMAARHHLLRDDSLLQDNSLLQDKGRIGPLFQRWVQDPDRDSAMAATALLSLAKRPTPLP